MDRRTDGGSAGQGSRLCVWRKCVQVHRGGASEVIITDDISGGGKNEGERLAGELCGFVGRDKYTD